MVAETLVEFPREAGWTLLEAADAANLEITAAFWLFLPEEEAWRLILASPATQTEGTINVAHRIRKFLDAMPESKREGLSLSDIAIVSPSLQVVDEMKSIYGEISEGHGRRVRRTSMSRSEPFIYRLT